MIGSQNCKEPSEFTSKNYVGNDFQKKSFMNPGKEMFQVGAANQIHEAAFLQFPWKISTPFFFGQRSTIYRAVWQNGQVKMQPMQAEIAAHAQIVGHLGVFETLQKMEVLSLSQSKEQKAVKGPMMCFQKNGKEFLKKKYGPYSSGILLKASNQLLYPFCNYLGKVLSALNALSVISVTTPNGDETIIGNRKVGILRQKLYSKPPKFADHPELACLNKAILAPISRNAVARILWVLFLSPALYDSSLRVYCTKVLASAKFVGGS